MKQVHGWAFPDADEFMASEIHPDGHYQYGHLEAALNFVRDFRVALDGGAHVGTWSKVLSGRFEQVLAVEPSVDTFQALAANMAAFGCQNVTLRNVALGAQPGTVSMILDDRAATMKNTGGRRVGPGANIAMTTIDSWELESLGFLKLDVEGSEVIALQGARRTLKFCQPIVLFENKGLWRRYGYTPNAPHDFLRMQGYKHYQKVGCDEIWGPA